MLLRIPFSGGKIVSTKVIFDRPAPLHPARKDAGASHES
jgi:hypothetical protein